MSVSSEIGNDGRATHNIKNYLHVPWEKVLQERNRPLLKSLLHAGSQGWLQVILVMGVKTYGKHGMVCEKERVGNNCPCAVPWDLLLVDKDAHELDNGKCRMGLRLSSAFIVMKRHQDPHVIELNGII